MARPRLELQALFEELLGSRNVYFQPPESRKMGYPCILYERSGARTDSADNLGYRRLNRYTVTVIDEDPDSAIPEKVSGLRYCAFDRRYKADRLNHDVFTLYF